MLKRFEKKKKKKKKKTTKKKKKKKKKQQQKRHSLGSLYWTQPQANISFAVTRQTKSNFPFSCDSFRWWVANIS